MGQVRLYFAPSCGDCRAAKRFLEERGVAYEAINIREIPGAAELVLQKNDGRRTVPTFEVDGRWFAVSPFDPDQLAAELGLKTS